MTPRAIVLFCAASLLGIGAHYAAYAASLSDPASLNEQAPAVYKAKFDTTKGPFVVEVYRGWAPNVKNGFYDNARFFRVIEGFMVQFGISGDPKISAVWRDANIPDDPVKQSNVRGNLSFATAGPNTRTTQVFVNFGDNAGLDGQGFSPFAKVVSGMEVVDSLYYGYGEGAPGGQGPNQGQIQMQGNAYLEKAFPKLDYIKKATIEQ